MTTDRRWKCNGRVQTTHFDPPVIEISAHHAQHMPSFVREKKIAIVNDIKERALINDANPRVIVKTLFEEQVCVYDNVHVCLTPYHICILL